MDQHKEQNNNNNSKTNSITNDEIQPICSNACRCAVISGEGSGGAAGGTDGFSDVPLAVQEYTSMRIGATVTYPPMSQFVPLYNIDDLNVNGNSGGMIAEWNFFSTLANEMEDNQRYSRKVFVGGLPVDIHVHDILSVFRHYGSLFVDWPHKSQTRTIYPMDGYAFLVFKDERSVNKLLAAFDTKLHKYFLSMLSNV